MFKVGQWSLNLKKNTLSDMIEHFYLFPPVCQLLGWHAALVFLLTFRFITYISQGEWKNDICPSIFFKACFFFFFTWFTVSVQALRSRWSFRFKKINLLFSAIFWRSRNNINTQKRVQLHNVYALWTPKISEYYLSQKQYFDHIFVPSF